MSQKKEARHYIVRGRVQGVGFRYFAQNAAKSIGVCGYVRNLDSGEVEVYAVGNHGQLAELAGMLWTGPRHAEVRGVEEKEAAVERCADFHVRH